MIFVNNCGINFNDASAYWMKIATNWGIYCDVVVNTVGFRGAGTEKASIDLDTGDFQEALGVVGDINATVDVHVGNWVFPSGGQICDA